MVEEGFIRFTAALIVSGVYIYVVGLIIVFNVNGAHYLSVWIRDKVKRGVRKCE